MDSKQDAVPQRGRGVTGKAAALLLLGTLLVSGCANSPSSSSAPQAEPRPSAPLATTLRIIIKFQTTVDAGSAEFQRRLAAESGAALHYVRPMSGGAHVFAVQGSLSAAEKQALLQKLSGRDDVVYAEEDVLMRPMTGK